MSGPGTRRQQLAEVMTRSIASVEEGTTLDRVAEVLADNNVGVVVVLDRDRLLGLVSERDLVLHLGAGAELAHLTAGEAMTTALVVCAPGDSVLEAAALMRDAGIRHLPVVEDGAVVGIVSARDVLGALLPAQRDGAHDRVG